MNFNLIFFDEQDSSSMNGIGSFRRQLLTRLAADCSAFITTVFFNSNRKFLEIGRNENGAVIYIPKNRKREWALEGALICPVLSQYIADTHKNVFVVNHSPCNLFIAQLKEMFPLSHIVFVIHNQGWCEPLRGKSELLLKLLHDKGMPNWVSSDDADFVKAYVEAEKAIYALSDAIVCLNSSTGKILNSIYGVDKKKIRLIPNGIEGLTQTEMPTMSTFRNRNGLKENDKLLLFVGRPTEAKGFRILLAAFRKLREDYPTAKLVVAGALSNLNYCQSEINKVASSLVLLGQISQEELSYWLKSSDIGVVPSYTEQCSMTALEMARAGLVIVSSNGNGLKDMFTDSVNAIVADIGNDADDEALYISNLHRVLSKAFETTENQREMLRNTAKDMMIEFYDASKMAQSYCRLFEEITKDS